jgi:hypothetical protein
MARQGLHTTLDTNTTGDHSRKDGVSILQVPFRMA